jgi:hypothetical protein
MKLKLRNQHETRHLEALDVEIRDAFVGPLLIAESGDQLGVCMRDDGFEITYVHDGDETVISCANGTVVL